MATAITDNLKCFKIKKDQLERQKYAVDIDGLKLEAGCQIVSKARYLCVPSAQTNFSPPPGNVSGPSAPSFVCYKAKCPRTDPPPEQTADDKFGSRTVPLSKTQWACVPLSSPSTAGTRCCNLAMSSPYTSFGCFDYVANVNAMGEWMIQGASICQFFDAVLNDLVRVRQPKVQVVRGQVERPDARRSPADETLTCGIITARAAQ